MPTASRALPGRRFAAAFTLVELLVVIGLLVLVISILLPALNRQRSASMLARLASRSDALSPVEREVAPEASPAATAAQGPARSAALVRSFDADVALTPMLSVGTTEPESIYEARFSAKLEIARPPAGSAAQTQPRVAGEAELLLPLPPQIVSLADLSVKVGGQSSDAVVQRGDKLVWHGPLAAEPTPVEVTYTAVGRGLYALQTPPGGIIDHFRIRLTANGSDVRMLDLSMQPTSTERASDRTVYTWDYRRLMFGRPIALDVLGIAPVDRLGELTWLGPASVLAFGILVGLVGKAFPAKQFDRWMLLLILGTFTGAYPMMYFAQEILPLNAAIGCSAAVVLVVIGARAATIMGLRLGLAGVALPAAAVMAITLTAAIRPNLQGMLLTILTLWLFVLAMVLAPRLHPGEGPRTPALA